MRDMAILVCSCDKYEDVWKPMFEMFYKFWENCPYNVYLMTNNASFDHPKVKTLSTGDDITWSKAFRNALERIEEDYVLIIMEDYILQSKVKNNDFKIALKYMKNNEIDYFRIFPAPRPTIKYGKCGDFNIGKIEPNAPYRVSLQAAIWKREYAISIIDDKDSAWQFEHMGSKRSSRDGSKFISVWDKTPRLMLDYYCTGVIQGYWIKEAVELCNKYGVEVDTTRIHIEPFKVRMKRLISVNYLGPIKNVIKKTKIYDEYRAKKYA